MFRADIFTLSRQLLDKLEWQAVETPSAREQWLAGRGEAFVMNVSIFGHEGTDNTVEL